jgi:hypothetical protein
MARHHRMPPEEAGYTYAVEPTANNRLLANEEESIYGHWYHQPLMSFRQQIRPGEYFTTFPVLLHINQGNSQLNDLYHFPMISISKTTGDAPADTRLQGLKLDNRETDGS